jgi:N-methylhydantoinase A/oxoprolinase/acetone carboxylase beta subunit
MGMLINIDNGGTLTDVCVLKDNNFYSTKTLTTPYDLSKCFFDGLKIVSKEVYGQEDITRLLAEAENIRYSTTQGTNAIVERKGPKLGMVIKKNNDNLIKLMQEKDPDLFTFLVADRVEEIDLADLNDEELATETATTITRLTASGANRIVVCFDNEDATKCESQFKRIAFDNYPRHLLGAVPMLFASELAEDISGNRRGWTALVNSFLHPAMESFLYNAENRLREYRTKNPLLIFRNDGDASRVAKTIALRTYSSGPRGGMEGVKEFSKQYSLNNVVSMDIGGTTTDIGQVINSHVSESRHGNVEGVPISFGLCEISSPGVGGSSILSVNGKNIQVGPESVGAVPGPASFGRGGKESTMTDVNLLMGLLDPKTFFGGGLKLDIDRARAAIDQNIASQLGITSDEALIKLRDAYDAKVSYELTEFAKVSDETVLLAFGGAGPMSACGVADKSGIETIFIPKTAAVFSAYGIGSCDIGQSYSAVLKKFDNETLEVAYNNLAEKAQRDMFAEGYSAGEYDISAQIVGFKGTDETAHELTGKAIFPKALSNSDAAILEFSARKKLRVDSNKKVKISQSSVATKSSVRSIFGDNQEWNDLPVYEVNKMKSGNHSIGPAVIEDEYFTCLVRPGWKFVVTELGDICLTKGVK